jgi:hypothetical protein
VLLCAFHHLIAIHRWGWQLILNPDGTTTAVSPDQLRTYRSHAPPTRGLTLIRTRGQIISEMRAAARAAPSVSTER